MNYIYLGLVSALIILCVVCGCSYSRRKKVVANDENDASSYQEASTTDVSVGLSQPSDSEGGLFTTISFWTSRIMNQWRAQNLTTQISGLPAMNSREEGFLESGPSWSDLVSDDTCGDSQRSSKMSVDSGPNRISCAELPLSSAQNRYSVAVVSGSGAGWDYRPTETGQLYSAKI